MAKYYKQNIPSLREFIKEKAEKTAYDIWDVAQEQAIGAGKGIAGAAKLTHRIAVPALGAVGLNARRLMPLGGAVAGANIGALAGVLGSGALAVNHPALAPLAAMGAPAAALLGGATGAVAGGAAGYLGHKLLHKLHKKASEETFFTKCAEAKSKYEETHEKAAFDVLDIPQAVVPAIGRTLGISGRRAGQSLGLQAGVGLGSTVGGIGGAYLGGRLMNKALANQPLWMRALGVGAGVIGAGTLGAGAGGLAGGYLGMKGGEAAGKQVDKAL